MAAEYPLMHRSPATLSEIAGRALVCVVLALLVACTGTGLEPWHTLELKNEFKAGPSQAVDSLEDYLALEQDLFRELDEVVYGVAPTGPEYSLQRYSPGSAADPRQFEPDWNRSFMLEGDGGRGGVLLLHGMSDSPYSLRALGLALNQSGYRVLGLRLPGHGTLPSGMLSLQWQDMAAVVTLAMAHLAEADPGAPLHIIGYSTGAALALDYALDTTGVRPSSLVLISPAVGVHRAAALASWKRRLAQVPGLSGLGWTAIETEFDPYKYNSFTTNAAEQVHGLTRSVAGRVAELAEAGQAERLPPILAIKSTVDATVSTEAVVDNLLNLLPPERNELLLFDINRFARTASLMIDDPGPLTRRLLRSPDLPFALTVVGNTSSEQREVSALHKPALSREASHSEELGLAWPANVFSLSHVALPFPADDPLYGGTPPGDRDRLFLGQQALQGERDVLGIPISFLLRLRHNPFYPYMEDRVMGWLDAAAGR